jgi:Helix-turn-helix domain
MSNRTHGPRRDHGATAAERAAACDAAAQSSPEIRSKAVFSQVPMDALQDRLLLPIDKVILGLLANHDNGKYCAWPTNGALATEAGCSLSTVKRALKRLEQLGWITFETCHRVERGQLIRLNWRRPPAHATATRREGGGGSYTTRGGVGHTRPGGWVTSDPGGGSYTTPNLDPAREPKNKEARTSQKPGTEPPKAPPDEDLRSPEEVQEWEGYRDGGDRILSQIARKVLAAHDAAVARGKGGETTSAAGALFGEEPTADAREPTVSNTHQKYGKTAQTSRPKNQTEHNGH